MTLPSYKVSKITGVPSFDSLPVAKITHYPLEKRDYKPFAQSILCVGDEALTLRMWAFEVSPLPESTLRCVLYCFRDKPDTALCVDIFSTGEVSLACLPDSRALAAAGCQIRDVSGEDLQGVYWGKTVTVPLDALEARGGPLQLSGGAHFPGNFYKLCPAKPFEHYGSCFPADFPNDPYSRSSMGTFEVVTY